MSDNSNSNVPKKFDVDSDSSEVVLRSFRDVWDLSGLMIQSGLYGTKNRAEVATKILTGIEMGIKPSTAVRHIDTIEGQPSVSAQLSAAMIRLSNKYKYEIEELSIEFSDDYKKVVDGRGAIAIYERKEDGWEKQGVGEFLWGEAVHAGLTRKNNWSNYPRDMLFARAMKRAKRLYASDVGWGREYMPDELGYEDKPTIEAPDNPQVTEQPSEDEFDAPANEESDDDDVTDASFTVEDESEGDVEFTEKEQSSDTKEGGNDISLDMQVKSEDDSDDEPTTISDVDKPDDENPDFRAVPGGLLGYEDESKIRQIQIELNHKEGESLLSAIGRYNDYRKEVSDEDFENELTDILNDHRQRLSHNYSHSELTDMLQDETVNTVKEIEENIENLDSIKDKKEQISNYENEAEKWSEPAATVLRGMLSNKKEELPESTGEPDDDKGRWAEFCNQLNTARTMLGSKMNDSHKSGPLNDLVQELDDQVRNYKDGPTDRELELWSKVRTPYVCIVKLREAVVDGGDIDSKSFNDDIVDFSNIIKEWGDEEEAQKAHDIVMNEVERINNNVEGFSVEIE